MIKDKTTITIVVEQRLEIDGVDSMSKTLVYETVEFTSFPEVLERIRNLIINGLRAGFKFLQEEN